VGEEVGACADLLTHLDPIARHGTRHALSDVEAGAILAEAALRAALLNVRGNARLLHDPDRAAAYLGQADDLESAGRAGAERVLATARDRTKA
jgi:formiminotetrahydrofolate cyclodeaminase